MQVLGLSRVLCFRIDWYVSWNYCL